MTEEPTAFETFLERSKERFDKYFAELGYVCFIFDKEKHKGQSVFITNSEESVLPIVEPYANAPKIAEMKVKRNELKNLRRIK